MKIDGVTKLADLQTKDKSSATRGIMYYNPKDKKQIEKSECKICLE